MNAVLIPVRSMTGAKNRLAHDLDEAARTRLTLAMLADMITAARSAASVQRVYVVSADEELLDRARRLGAHALRERLDDVLRTVSVSAPAVRGGLNRAVFAAATSLAQAGIERLLTIPGDVPLIAAEEIDALFAASAFAPVVIVASGSGTGTNALLTSPPDVIVPQFEGESLVAHRRACGAAGLRHVEHSLAGFELDIDTMEDLRVLAAMTEGRESVRVAADLTTPREPRLTGTAS
jgi:2-phospho-L-lactate guanylyltransferase